MSTRPIVLPSPLMLDHSFPRNMNELNTAKDAISVIQDAAESGECFIGITDIINEFTAEFAWGSNEYNRFLVDIHTLLIHWTDRQHEYIFCIAVEGQVCEVPHKLPAECVASNLTEKWQEQTGIVFKLHLNANPDTPFIGVASALKLSGQECQGYAGEGNSFQLLGLADLRNLGDAIVYAVPNNAKEMPFPSFDDAKKNMVLIGGKVAKKAIGSHYKVSFPNGHSWPLDKNHDPLLERYVKELQDITGIPWLAIKVGLVQGKLPQLQGQITRVLR